MEQEKKPNLRKRLVLLYVLSFLVTVAPILICFTVKWDDYVATPEDGVKLCAGGVIAAVLLLLAVIGKLHVPSRIVAYTAVVILAYLLQAVLDDLLLISGMVLLGEFLDCILFKRAIRVTREDILVEKAANATSAQVEKVIEKYIGRV